MFRLMAFSASNAVAGGVQPGQGTEWRRGGVKHLFTTGFRFRGGKGVKACTMDW